MTAQVAADLRAAADVLRRDGWTQGDFGAVDGCKCLYGALNYVATEGRRVQDEDLTGEQIQRVDVAARYVFPLIKVVHPVYVADWNDAPGRTADEVIAALEAAADAAEAQQ